MSHVKIMNASRKIGLLNVSDVCRWLGLCAILWKRKREGIIDWHIVWDNSDEERNTSTWIDPLLICVTKCKFSSSLNTPSKIKLTMLLNNTPFANSSCAKLSLLWKLLVSSFGVFRWRLLNHVVVTFWCLRSEMWRRAQLVPDASRQRSSLVFKGPNVQDKLLYAAVPTVFVYNLTSLNISH
jgi:hypothetical protein